jgi:hypothetical protein
MVENKYLVDNKSLEYFFCPTVYTEDNGEDGRQLEGGGDNHKNNWNRSGRDSSTPPPSRGATWRPTWAHTRFLSGRTCTIGGWLNTFLLHCISEIICLITMTCVMHKVDVLPTCQNYSLLTRNLWSGRNICFNGSNLSVCISLTNFKHQLAEQLTDRCSCT